MKNFYGWEPNQNSTVSFFCENDSMIYTHATFSSIYRPQEIEIEVSNNHNLTITTNAPLSNINVIDGSTVTLNNSYVGEVKTAITIGSNGTVTQTGKDLSMGTITLSPQAQFNCTFNGSNYGFHNPKQLANGAAITQEKSDITINDFHKLVETAVNLKEHDAPYTFKELVFYEKNSALNLFIQQNVLYMDTDKIKSDLAKNYFEFTGVAKSFKGSNLEKLPNKMIVEIASYLKIKDIDIAEPAPLPKIEINHYSNIEETTPELIGNFSE